MLLCCDGEAQVSVMIPREMPARPSAPGRFNHAVFKGDRPDKKIAPTPAGVGGGLRQSVLPAKPT